MKCCFIGYRDNFGNKKEYKPIEDAIKKLVDICDICLYLPCNNIKELNLLGYAEKNNKKIFVIE